MDALMPPKLTHIRNYRVYRKVLKEAWVFTYRGHEIAVHFPAVRFKGRPMQGWQFSKDGIPLTQIDRAKLEDAIAEFMRLGAHWDDAKFGAELAATVRDNIR
jgi:hypothetical protein